MRTRASRPVLALALTAVLVVAAAACGGAEKKPAAGEGTALVGTFRLDPGRCVGKGAQGTYFRMINRNGTAAKGPYFGNPDSPCQDDSFNVQVPGTDGGLVTGTFQGGPIPPFDKTGNARATRIVKPGSFTAIQFGIATEKVDPSSKKNNPAPQIFLEDGRLTGQLTAWTAAWNNLYFNQGSPKPDGSSPGQTSPVTGTYDQKSRKFVLSWTSQVVGGPFDQFAGYWHLAGTFVPQA